MSARFEITHRRPGAEGLRDILRRQIEAAHATLAARHLDDEKIHQARKHIKTARGTLRLLRAAAGERAYRHANRLLRDAGRRLSAARDAPVLLKSMERLRDKMKDLECRRRLEGLRAVLCERAAQARHEARRSRCAQARAALRTTLASLKSWPEPDGDWAGLRRGLRRTYRKGRRAARDNARNASSESLHEWRKVSKYLRSQLQLIAPLQHASLTRLTDRLHALTDDLGEDHDLAVLLELTEHEAPHLDSAAVRSLTKLIARRRKKLQRSALQTGYSLYAEKAGHLDGRLAHYLDCWSH